MRRPPAWVYTADRCALCGRQRIRRNVEGTASLCPHCDLPCTVGAQMAPSTLVVDTAGQLAGWAGMGWSTECDVCHAIVRHLDGTGPGSERQAS